MKKSLSIVSFALLAGLAASCNNTDKEAKLAELKKEQASLQSEIQKLETELRESGKLEEEKVAVPVAVVEVKPDTFRHYLEVQGKVDFDKNALISAKVPGVLTSVRVDRGDKVSQGQLLATIDATVLEQNILEVKTAQELANTVYEKQKRLWDQKIGTEIQYLQAKNNKESLERKLATLQKQYDQYNIKAPFSGMVDDVMPKTGEAVSPGIGIIRLVNLSGSKVVAELSEAYSDKVSKGDKARVYFPDINKEIETEVAVVSQVINPTNRTFTVELSIKPEDRAELSLRPNMVAVTRIEDYSNKNVPVLPVNLVQKDGQTSYVYVVEKEGNQLVTKRKNVTTGRTYKGEVEVLNGLTANDKVVSAGQQNVADGTVVSVQETTALN
ncbi:MAG: efflux RND transporter periplasmic adaptor subunit [Hymenobacteraceae bacterium]|nr:efflux RND transporter periplasmic adaptor subunit [Hymenobacteraceae bacterium]MDX5395005.1 efflux RND transporter periplasmic adaptor subunit [Hymenobacteraceae bacterium]MDX5511038.1 efflux RND transporter periplasmic adaptor subunit [Hymenobacteraceae bacterium]